MTKSCLKVAVISESAANWPVYIAQEKGFFARYRLEVEMQVTGCSKQQMELLTKGGVYDIGHSAADHIIRAVDKGSDLCIIMGLNSPYFSLMASPGTSSYHDLIGKKLGVDGTSTGYALLLKGLLKQHGLAEIEHYQLVPLGGTVQRLQGLLAGQVTAAFLDAPADLEAEQKGYLCLGSNLDFMPDYQGRVAAAKREWAVAHVEPVVQYIKSYIMASDWFYDRRNQEDAIDILRRSIDCSQHEAELSYQRYTEKKIFNMKARINFTGLRNVLKVMAEQGETPRVPVFLEKYVDESYYHLALDQLEGR